VRDIIPLAIGSAPFGLLFGVLARGIGLPLWATILMSAIVFAGASQFAAVKLIAAGAAAPFIILTTFVINLRHALYTASLSGYTRQLRESGRAFLAATTTDESYAMVMTHYRDETRGSVNTKLGYFLGANLAMYFPWQLDTLIGYAFGNLLGDPLALGLDFAATLMFIAILIPQIKSRADLAGALIAGAVAVIAFALPSKLGLLLAIGAGISVGIIVEYFLTKRAAIPQSPKSETIASS
ncbi:MAG: AzlC family ABC transporter permease, partial [Chloroflexi bacterium]|nr:AzlC family ABC transporter permease [Chloroflexota bacterium]